MFMIEEGSRVHIASNMLKGGGTLLDAGCGQGDLYDLIKIKYAEIYGVDIDLKALKRAKTKGYSTVKGDLNKETLPFRNSSFDAVVCLDVIEHLIDPRYLLKEVHRVLKEGGILIISTPNVQWLYHLLRLLCGRGLKTSFSSLNDPLNGGHLHYFTFRDVKKMLEAHKFKILQEDGTYHVGNKFLRYIIKLLKNVNFLRPYFSPAIVIKAKKDE
jgi:methionine biosynthesis protein MetW